MILSVNGIRFSYNSHPVLENISFRLGCGKVLGVLGVNGAGKSTLLKCLNRILKPQDGSVLLEGKNIHQMKRRDIARKIGYLPQKDGDSKLTVFESVLLGRKPHANWAYTDSDYAIAEDVIIRLGLEHLAHRSMMGLSGGEIQKTAIARALAQSPRVLLLDEPTSSLDLKNQIEVMAFVRKIVRENMLAAVISIHDLNLAVRFADHFLLMKDKSICASVEKKGLTPEMIRNIYGIDVLIREVEGYPIVIPLQ